MPVKILVPRRLADRSRFPLADVVQVPLEGGKWAEIDTRESPDHMVLGIPSFLDTLTEHECERAGLSPNPNDEGRAGTEPERIRERLRWRSEESRLCKPPSLSRNDERPGMDFAMAFSIPTKPDFS